MLVRVHFAVHVASQPALDHWQRAAWSKIRTESHREVSEDDPESAAVQLVEVTQAMLEFDLSNAPQPEEAELQLGQEDEDAPMEEYDRPPSTNGTHIEIVEDDEGAAEDGEREADAVAEEEAHDDAPPQAEEQDEGAAEEAPVTEAAETAARGQPSPIDEEFVASKSRRRRQFFRSRTLKESSNNNWMSKSKLRKELHSRSSKNQMRR
jgi:hypothetical protein